MENIGRKERRRDKIFENLAEETFVDIRSFNLLFRNQNQSASKEEGMTRQPNCF